MLWLVPGLPILRGCRQYEGRRAGTVGTQQPWGQAGGRAVSASSRLAGAMLPEQQVTVCCGTARLHHGQEQP